MLKNDITGQTFKREEIERLYGGNFADNNRVRLLWKGKELFDVIFGSVSKAKRIVCLEFYIFRNDETGNELARLLKKKASEGVYIYILYDHFGSFGTPRKFWQGLKKSGINVRASRPFKWTAPLRYVHRDHKKLIIIDGEKAFTGGLNIANEYRGYRLKRKRRRVEKWRDTGIMLDGTIAMVFLNEFRKGWTLWGGEPIETAVRSQKPKIQDAGYKIQDNHASCIMNHASEDSKLSRLSESPVATTLNSDGLPVLPIFASSSRGRRKFRRLLYYSINHSRESIFLTTAYFTPSRRMIDALSNAVLRGVQVKILLPYESDVPAAHYAARASYERLLRAGVEIYNYRGNILHAKTSVFDRNWSIIGSANLDSQSLRWNDEGNAGILDEGFGKQMTDVFHEDLKQSIKIELNQWSGRSLLEKVKERFFYIFRRRL